jgi:penicillin-binding protein A
VNGTIRRTSVVIGLLLAALLINANVLAVLRDNAIRNRAGNGRLIIEQYNRDRGSIVVGRRAVAKSIATSGRLKYQRVYPEGRLNVAATGYYSLFGATGIERTNNDLLSGDDDRLFVDRLTNLFSGRQTQGGNVVLTLNADAQRAAMQGLDGQRGAVVALDPRTGAVLALASSPSFNPNIMASHDPDVVNKYFNQLDKDPSQPMLDRPIQQTYPPGSLFKVVVAAAALSSGKYTPNTSIPAPASLPLPDTDKSINNYDGLPCFGGSATLTQALVISCNTAFAGVGLDLGADALRKQAEAFGFNRGYTIPLPVVPSVFPRELNAPQTAQSAIGQFDVRATAMQMAMVGAGVADGGLVMKPYLVAQEQAPDLSVLAATQPEILSRAVTPAVAQQLTDMMVAVVDEGTGIPAAIPGISVAGKTGTAQDGPRPPHVWFMAFAPADDPKVAVAVVVENGGRLGNDATGGSVAGPIAKAVMEAVLQ